MHFINRFIHIFRISFSVDKFYQNLMVNKSGIYIKNKKSPVYHASGDFFYIYSLLPYGLSTLCTLSTSEFYIKRAHRRGFARLIFLWYSSGTK